MHASATGFHIPRRRAARRARAAAGPDVRPGLIALLLAAVALRVWLMIGYGPAFVGFGDSHEYLTAASGGVFGDPQKPAGYPIFLAALHAVSHGLLFTIAVQHLLGVLTGVLLWASARRLGAPPSLAVLAGAVALLQGTGLLLEHSLLADPLFCFLQSCAIYATTRSLATPGARFAMLAGLAAGASFWVKTVGIAGVVIVPPMLLLASREPARRRLRAAAVAAAVGGALVLAYPLIQGIATGYWGYERQAAWNLYGRVATFVDCSRFDPPAGTRSLCPTQPPSDREPPAYYQYAPGAPAVRRFGGPSRAPAYANGLLERFSVAAIVHEPLGYLGAILRGLGFYVAPRAGEGYTPRDIRSALLDARDIRAIDPALAAYYDGARGSRSAGGVGEALGLYETATRVQGVVLIALLLAAGCGIALLSGVARAGAVLLTAMAICPVVLADAANSYDARYGYPAFGALAAAATLGCWGIGERVRSSRRRTAATATPAPQPATEPMLAGWVSPQVPGGRSSSSSQRSTDRPPPTESVGPPS